MAHRILILDDDEDFNNLLTDIFSQSSYEVTSLKDPEEALGVYRSTPFDLIVTDQKMPGMSGEEFIRAVKQLDPDVPVIMVSGYLDNDTIRDLIREGVGGGVPQTTQCVLSAQTHRRATRGVKKFRPAQRSRWQRQRYLD